MSHFSFLRSGWFILLSIFFLNACNGPSPVSNERKSGLDTLFVAEDLKRPLLIDSTLCDSIAKSNPALAEYCRNARLFYSARNWSPAWYGSDSWREHAAFLMQLVGTSSLEGISDTFPALLEVQDDMSRYTGIGEFNARLDVMLTSAFFWYAEKAWNGLPEKTSRALDWFLPRLHKDSRTWLDSALTQQPDAGLLSKAVFIQYYRLRSEIQVYDSLRKRGGWPTLNPVKLPLYYGDTGSDVIALKKSLFAHGDLVKLTDDDSFDSTLTVALIHFQQRHGLKPDGTCGKNVVKALNVTVEDRITQMLLNLERCRWMPNALPDRFLLVNIPEFTLHLIDDRVEKEVMPVVVGKDVHQTVSFSGSMRTVVFHPYWVVPSGILYDEIIPAAIRSTSYIKRNNMEVVGGSGGKIPSSSVNWKNYRRSGFPYKVQQRPGPDNPLGEVKFLFPNNYSIYLHDSPSKSLFGKEKRTFSHGCIRVGDARRLAEFVLADEGWSVQAVDSAFKTRKERWVKLKRDLPVYIVYFTSWVDQKGVLHFREDIYGRDERLRTELLK
jgi:murein L,D-transpeptidase YcbB/YkuD